MAKDPTIPLYASDAYMDTIQMDERLVGAYFRLLCVLWVNGNCYYSAMALANVSPSAKEAVDLIKHKFTFHEDGTFTNNRMEETRLKRKELRELREKVGQLGAQKRWQNDSKHSSKNNSKKMAKETEIEIEIDIEKREEKFELWWSQYPLRGGKKVGKAEAKKKFLSFENQDQLFIALNHYNNSQIVKDGFAKDAKRFLSNDFWKDWLDGPGEVSSGNGMLSKAGQRSMKNAEIAFRDLEQKEPK